MRCGDARRQDERTVRLYAGHQWRKNMAIPVSEYEMEAEVSPMRKIYPDAMMEHLAHEAAAAESGHRAARVLLPIVPMAASRLAPRLAPSVARALPTVMPRLAHGVSTVTQGLFRRPQTRHLVRTIPTIVNRTVTSLANRASQGLPVTPQTAIRTLTQQTAQMIRNPQQRAIALRRSNVFDRQFHRMTGTIVRRRGSICPHCGVTVVVRPPSCCGLCGHRGR
jgi:hypothetical protein